MTATVTDRRYPLLFQIEETAYGVPLVNAQHPHNFIMGLGFHYTREVSEDTILDAYFAPVGDPALEISVTVVHSPIDRMGAGQLPISRVVSMGRRNTGLEFIGWSLKSQCFSRPLIQT